MPVKRKAQAHSASRSARASSTRTVPIPTGIILSRLPAKRTRTVRAISVPYCDRDSLRARASTASRRYDGRPGDGRHRARSEAPDDGGAAEVLCSEAGPAEAPVPDCHHGADRALRAPRGPARRAGRHDQSSPASVPELEQAPQPDAGVFPLLADRGDVGRRGGRAGRRPSSSTARSRRTAGSPRRGRCSKPPPRKSRPSVIGTLRRARWRFLPDRADYYVETSVSLRVDDGPRAPF